MRVTRLLLACLLAAASCVHREHSDVEAARAAYEECVAQHSASGAECAALHERLRAAEQRYQDNARRAWGCDPAQTECPTPR